MRKMIGIKPQDILLLMKIITCPMLSQKELADELMVSQGEVSHGIKRLKNSQLLNSTGKIIKESCIEFLIHAVKFICPAQLGTLTMGLPTSFAHPNFKFIKYSADDVMVWPHPEGKVKGIALYPIYSTLPKAVANDKKLYELACYVEMIRSGRARERKIGSEKIQDFIEGINEK